MLTCSNRRATHTSFHIHFRLRSRDPLLLPEVVSQHKLRLAAPFRVSLARWSDDQRASTRCRINCFQSSSVALVEDGQANFPLARFTSLYDGQCCIISTCLRWAGDAVIRSKVIHSVLEKGTLNLQNTADMAPFTLAEELLPHFCVSRKFSECCAAHAALAQSHSGSIRPAITPFDDP